jgi:hypothetical protein
MGGFGSVDRFLDEEDKEKVTEKRVIDSVSVPSNDNDIDGIEKYLGWHMYKAGMSSNVFHYLGVLVEKARKDT